MNEKLAVDDILSSQNAILTKMTHAIEQANNEEFRDFLIDERKNLDNLKWDTYLIAKEKGYYIPAAPAGEADIALVKSAIES